MNATEQRIEAFYSAIRTNIFAYCRAMNYDPSHQQRQALSMVQCGHPLTAGEPVYRCGPECDGRPHKFIAIKSGKGPGKTVVAGIVAGWRTNRDVRAYTVVTSPTMRQNKDIWLAEFKRQLAKADPLLRYIMQVTGLKVDVAGDNEWGIKLVTANREENAAGYHQKTLTIVVEEASGVEAPIFRAFEHTLTNQDALMFVIGNPTQRGGPFFECFHSRRAYWKTLTFNAEETPKSEWFNPNRNERIAEQFGKDSDPYRIAVLGEFPHANPSSIITNEDIEGCQGTNPLELVGIKKPWHDDRDPDDPFVRQFGIDFARFGPDESTVFVRLGGAIIKWRSWSHTDPNHVLDWAFKEQLEMGWSNADTLYVVDAGGLAQGLLQRFYDADKNLIEFHNGVPSSEPEFGNLITEAWFYFAKRAKKRLWNVPKDDLTTSQLVNRLYTLNKEGKVIVESKEDYKKRMQRLGIITEDETGGSPDRAEGLIYACYDGQRGLANTTVERKYEPARKIGARVAMQ